MGGRAVPPERIAAQKVLYDADWTDGKIARALALSPQTIAKWRAQNELPPARSACSSKIDNEEALRMYDAGASDGDIARRFGATQSGATRWRQRHGLLPNVEPNARIDAARTRTVKRMLRLGATKRQVSATVGINPTTVQRIRRGMRSTGLRRSGLSNRSIRHQVLKDRSIERRISRAIGDRLPNEVQYEAVMALYTDVLDGRVDRQFIEQVAPAYREQAWSVCGSKFGPRSLDEELAEDWTIGDTLEDPYALEALEAAAELAYEMG